MSTDARRECCRDPENLYVAEVDEREDGRLTLRRCKVCDRRHFDMEAQPMVMAIRPGT
jgi:hypothetical protein